jgi:hypothetical protein
MRLRDDRRPVWGEPRSPASRLKQRQPNPLPARRPNSVLDLSPSAALALQRTVGNAAVSALLGRRTQTPTRDRRQKDHDPRPRDAQLAVQRYAILEPSGYALDRGARFEAQRAVHDDSSAYFVRRTLEQESEGVTETEQRRLSASAWSAPEQRRSTVRLPRLRYAQEDDRAMAIEDTDADTEAKVFYATPNVVRESNSKLQAAGSKTQLEIVGASLQVPREDGEGPLVLEMVKPHTLDERGRFGEIAQCDAFVINIIGTLGERVAVVGRDHPQEIGVGATHEPGQAIAALPTAEPLVLPESFAPEMSRETPPVAGDEERDRTLGINASALAEVGEGYVIVSYGPMPGDETGGVPSEEYLVAVDKQLERFELSLQEQAWFRNRWAYHYAGVVARVGADQVTLENYNRDVARGLILDRLYTRAVQDIRALRKLVLQAESIPAISSVRAAWFRQQRERLGAIAASAHDARSEAHRALVAVEERSEGLKVADSELWHFKMYGPEPGQSFHEQWSPAHDSPITLRIRQASDPRRSKRRLVAAADRLVALAPDAAVRSALNAWASGPLRDLGAVDRTPVAVDAAFKPCKREFHRITALAIGAWATEAARATPWIVRFSRPLRPPPTSEWDEATITEYAQTTADTLREWGASSDLSARIDRAAAIAI